MAEDGDMSRARRRRMPPPPHRSKKYGVEEHLKASGKPHAPSVKMLEYFASKSSNKSTRPSATAFRHCNCILRSRAHNTRESKVCSLTNLHAMVYRGSDKGMRPGVLAPNSLDGTWCERRGLLAGMQGAAHSGYSSYESIVSRSRLSLSFWRSSSVASEDRSEGIQTVAFSFVMR